MGDLWVWAEGRRRMGPSGFGWQEKGSVGASPPALRRKRCRPPAEYVAREEKGMIFKGW